MCCIRVQVTCRSSASLICTTNAVSGEKKLCLNAGFLFFTLKKKRSGLHMREAKRKIRKVKLVSRSVNGVHCPTIWFDFTSRLNKDITSDALFDMQRFRFTSCRPEITLSWSNFRLEHTVRSLTKQALYISCDEQLKQALADH